MNRTTPYEPELSEEVASRKKGLRSGWTTGTCASAAAKAAALILATGERPAEVEVAIPNGRRVSFPVEYPLRDADEQAAVAVVVKDAGDDPDCTDGARLTATAHWAVAGQGIEIRGGSGVGVVTKPGLGLPVGGPAINPVPRRMIEQAVREVTDRPVVIEISVPSGAEMALKTTNARLGIVGGISILGTTGIVRPFSTAAYRASVVQQIDVAAALGNDLVVLATGHRTDSLAMRQLPHLDEVCFVEVGDFTGVALKRCAGRSIGRVVFVGMVGKIAKLAAGVMMTHFHRSEVDTALLEEAARRSNAPEAVVVAATETSTARHFGEVCLDEGVLEPLELLCRWAARSCRAFVSEKVEVEVWMSDFEGERVVAKA